MKTFLRNNKTLLIIIAVLSFSLAFYLSTSGPRSGKKNLGQVTKGEFVQRVTISGSIIPQRKTIISPPYTGYVKKIFVKVGDLVKVGDPLVTVTQSLQSLESAYPLRAPFSGTVVHIERSEGEYIREGDSKDFVMRIDDLTHMFIQSSAAEVERTRLTVGMEAVAKPSALLNKTYKAVIREMSLSAKDKDPWSRSSNSQMEFPVRLEILNPDLEIKSGMSVVIDIITQSKKDVTMLRLEFVQRDSGKDGDQYFVTLKDGSRRNIKVGLQNEEVFEILEGLTPKDEILPVDFAGMVKE